MNLLSASFCSFPASYVGGKKKNSMCLMSLTDFHAHVIAVVSSLILNRKSQKLLLSQAPSHLQSRICEHNKTMDLDGLFFLLLRSLRQICTWTYIIYCMFCVTNTDSTDTWINCHSHTHWHKIIISLNTQFWERG